MQQTAAASAKALRWTKAAGPGALCRVAQADWLDAAAESAPSTVDLLYVDPPFNTGKRQSAGAGAFEDAWPSTEAYVEWLRTRLGASVGLLKPTGSILLHVDWRICHHARLALDEIFGEPCFVNHLVWEYGLGGSSPRRFARKHDDILFYCVEPSRYWFEPPMAPSTSRRMAGKMKKATDVLRVPSINNMARERVGWPTQKPLALLKVLIGACCPRGGLVFDPCCGSGTTLVAARAMGRAAVGCDTDERAVGLTLERLRVAGAVDQADQSPA